ncbi:MAG: biotin/lipoyl-containing protein, partial [Myxococcota bacterium]
FLSENAAFAAAVEAAGLVWVGPPPAAIAAMGDKARARRVAEAQGVPVVPGHEGDQDPAALEAAASQLGFPVLIKAVAGGGGRGMRRVDAASGFAEALASARREAGSSFGDDRVIVERYVTRPRHIEVQVLADRHGAVLSLGERECSIQRRHQKVVEEAPSPGVSAALRAEMGAAAVAVARAVGYVGAGTVEFIVDASGRFYFLEMNTRLQVEHPVTECVTGLDLVELQLRVAEGEPLPLTQDQVALRGHAIEVRLYAEDPSRGYLPGTGPLHRLHLPGGEGLRIDAGYATGDVVSPHYDSMLAKLVAHGPDRATATRRLRGLVERAWAPGVVTNLPLLRQILAHPAWVEADLDTAFLERVGLPVAPPLNLERGALAATILGVTERRPTLAGPSGWRMGGRAEQVDRWRCGSEQVEVWWTPTDDGATVRIGAATHAVRVVSRDGDAWVVAVDGVRQNWRMARVPASPAHRTLDDGDLVYVHLGDGEAFVQLEPRFPERAEVAAEPGQCVAHTPGKVVFVAVAVGDVVAAGQRLLTLEAMKMEHPVTAPEAGVVAELRVALGDAVSEGELLARIAPVSG